MRRVVGWSAIVAAALYLGAAVIVFQDSAKEGLQPFLETIGLMYVGARLLRRPQQPAV